MSFLIALFEGEEGGSPVASDAASYAAVIGQDGDPPDFLVSVDLSEQVFDRTPYDRKILPGKCVLTPEMVMLDCVSGDGNVEVFDLIRFDVEGRSGR